MNRTINPDMKIYTVSDEQSKDLIRKVIFHNGNSPEHNLEYFMTMIGTDGLPIFACFEDFKGILAVKKGKLITVISEVMAKPKERAGFFKIFVEEIYSIDEYKSCKLYLETSEDFKKELSRSLNGLRINEKFLSIGNNVYTYYTPIICLDEWDENLSGSKMSNIRKSKNRLYRDPSIKLLKGDAVKTISYDSFEKLVLDWKKNRTANDKVEYDKYLQFFRNGCNGADVIVAITKNGLPIAVAAGWTVPNPDYSTAGIINAGKSIYYSINIHDYSLAELGDVIAAEFISESKKHLYNYLDFGGSGEKLLAYKKKFNPKAQYIAQCYYISLK